MEGTKQETEVIVRESGRPGPTTLVTAGMHGDEKCGIKAAERIAEWTVNAGKLVVIPRCNRFAAERDVRGIAYDLNRAFPPRGGDCTTALAREIWAIVEECDPDWAFDLHSSRGIYRSGDGGVGQAIFPTWSDPAREVGEQTVTELNKTFGLRGDMAYRMGNTLDADRDMLMHRIAGFLDRPGFICETTEKAETLAEQVQWQLFTVEFTMQQYGQYRVEKTPQVSNQLRTGNIHVGNAWQPYLFSEELSDPIVIQKALSKYGIQPAHTRLRNVGTDGFECRIEEWTYLDGGHMGETCGYIALDTGIDGPIETGRVTTTDDFTPVAFESAFSTTPAILAASQTYNDPNPIVTRVTDASRDGFRVSVQEEEGTDRAGHHAEEVGYVAVEPGTHTIKGKTVEAGVITGEIKVEWSPIEFEDPVFLAAIQSFDGWNPCNIRYRNLTGSSVEVHIQEEQSRDSETNHVDESVGYLVIEG